MSKRFLQTKFWAEFKAAHGWKAYYFKIDADKVSLIDAETYESSSENENTLALLVRQFLRKFSIAYIPMAIEKNNSQENCEEYFTRLYSVSQKIKAFLPANTICLRYDIPFDFYSTEERDLFVKETKSTLKAKKLNIVVSPVAVQPPDTVLLSLLPSEDEILSNMKSKWRYNIRLAEKKGVKVTKYHFGESEFEDAFDKFYALFEITGKRDGISPHAKSYYKDLLERGSKENSSNVEISLYLARHENDTLAGIITLFCKKEAVYLYGASSNVKRNLMPAYLCQWTAIKDAKDYGCPVYDFYGMPPTDDPNHPMHGLYLFKTGFGGQCVHRPGSIDVPIKNIYKLYSTAEKIRAWYHKKFLKKIRGR